MLPAVSFIRRGGIRLKQGAKRRPVVESLVLRVGTLSASLYLLTATGAAMAQDAAPSDSIAKNAWVVVANASNEGAFVLPAGDMLNANDRIRVYLRVGYIGHGSLARVVGNCRIISAKKKSARGTYCHIRSEQGVEGLVKTSLLFPLKLGKTYAIPLKASLEDDPLYLYQVKEPRSPRHKAAFNRRVGTVVEVTGDWRSAGDDDYIAVVKTWDGGRQTLLKSDMVNRMEVIETPEVWGHTVKRHMLRYDPSANDWIFSEGPVRTGRFKAVTEHTKERLLGSVSHAFGAVLTQDNGLNAVRSLFETTARTVDSIACSANAHVEASLGWGLKIAGELPLLKEDMTFDVDADVVFIGGGFSYYIVSLKTITCSRAAGVIDSAPVSISAMTIFLAKGAQTSKGVRIPIDAVKRFGLTPAFTVVEGPGDDEPRPKMYTIQDHSDHAKALRMTRRYMQKIASVWDSLSPEEQQVLLEALVAKLGDFERQG